MPHKHASEWSERTAVAMGGFSEVDRATYAGVVIPLFIVSLLACTVVCTVAAVDWYAGERSCCGTSHCGGRAVFVALPLSSLVVLFGMRENVPYDVGDGLSVAHGRHHPRSDGGRSGHWHGADASPEVQSGGARRNRPGSLARGKAPPPMLLPISLRQLETGERIFVDDAGRERVFRGTNAVVRGPPWIPDTSNWSPDISLVDKDFEILQSSGVTLLRLGAMWPAVEPKRGEYNHTFLRELRQLSDRAAHYGIYTLLDGHQDAFSERFCGAGMPSWLRPMDESVHKQIISTGKPPFWGWPAPNLPPITEFYREPLMNDALFPTRNACSANRSPFNQATFEAGAAYEALYLNKNGMADAWAAMWAQVMTYFKGAPHLLGIELINEPFAGDVGRHPGLFAPWPNPWNADRVRLQPVYDRINAAVRRIDEHVLIFFAGIVWGVPGFGFSAPPGGDAYGNRSVLVVHYYDPPNGEPSAHLDRALRGARRTKVGLCMTETSLAEHPTLFDELDHRRLSWSHWQYKKYCREHDNWMQSHSHLGAFGSCSNYFLSSTPPIALPDAYKIAKARPAAERARTADHVWAAQIVHISFLNSMKKQQPQLPPSMLRTYASAVAGTTLYTAFNDTTKVFTLRFVVEPAISQPTVLRLSTEANYPNGFRVKVSPQWALKVATPKMRGTSSLIELVPHSNVTRDTEVTVLVLSRRP